MAVAINGGKSSAKRLLNSFPLGEWPALPVTPKGAEICRFVRKDIGFRFERSQVLRPIHRRLVVQGQVRRWSLSLLKGEIPLMECDGEHGTVHLYANDRRISLFPSNL